MFQSAPRARARGDRSVRALHAKPSGFNPRPAHARGATHRFGRQSDRARVSIRAPRTRAGRRQTTSTKTALRPVSIRAPRTRAGRQHSLELSLCLNEFQSAPRARARGDAFAANTGHGWASFNPRPAHARGATFVVGVVGGFDLVSIRAPRTRAGRPCSPQRTRCGSWFQSAPRARARGDVHVAVVRCELFRFNPRPAHARGATAALPNHRTAAGCYHVSAKSASFHRALNLNFQRTNKICPKNQATEAAAKSRRFG